jgi:hypothetical protein
MTGNEVKKILLDNGFVLSEIAEKIGITPQSLQARLGVKYFKPEYIQELNGILGRDLFGVSNSLEEGQKILDIRVCAGHGIGLDGNENKVLEIVNIPHFQGCYGLTVYGESMWDKYKPGETVFVRPITSPNDIDYGRCYVVITSNDRLLKSIYQSKYGPDYLKLCSYNAKVNPSGEREYPDREISKEDILFLYKVVGKLEREQL